MERGRHKVEAPNHWMNTLQHKAYHHDAVVNAELMLG